MKKKIRIVVYVIFALVIVYFGVQWILESKIRNLVEKKIYEVTRGTVKAEVGSVSLRLISRSLWLKEVKISSDTGAGLQNGLPLITAEGYLKKVGIRGIRFKKKDSVIYLRAKGVELDVSRYIEEKPGYLGYGSEYTALAVTNTKNSCPARSYPLL